MADGILVLNAGSSSLKFALYRTMDRQTLLPGALEGSLEEITTHPHFTAWDADGQALIDADWSDTPDFAALLGRLIAWIETHLGPHRLLAAGHRVVHGGSSFKHPTLITPSVMADLARFIPLAPLHQPYNLAPITALTRQHPDLVQIACFDTAFHAETPAIARRFALPRDLEAEGVVRYGFHGLSYTYVAERLADLDPAAHRGRAILCHLGNGASACALLNGQPIASTMGFSALDGLMMGTRCGTIDPAVIFYLIREKGLSLAAVERMLYRESGLKGVSGLSSDMRTLMASTDPAARHAVDLFVYRAIREIGSLTAALGGLDALVFTGGIGEHATAVTAQIADGFAWLGANRSPAGDMGEGRFSTPDSAVRLWVIPTNEDLVIARDTLRHIPGPG